MIDPSVGPDFINLNCTILNDSTCIVSGKLFLKNNTNKTLILDSSNYLLTLENNSIPLNNNLGDSTHLFFKQFIESVSPDSFFLSKSFHGLRILEPRESISLFFYRKMEYSIKNIESFLRFNYLNNNEGFYFHMYTNLVDEDGNHLYYGQQLRILNFIQDVKSINEHGRAIINYRIAENMLKIKGIKYQPLD